jgi:hypothetical protein
MTGVTNPGPEEPEEPVLPEQTRDDADVWGGDWRESDGEDASRDAWLERERPPHWE